MKTWAQTGALSLLILAGHAGAATTLAPETVPSVVELGAEFGPVRVRVTDANGNPVPGASVTWPKNPFVTSVRTVDDQYRFCPFDPLAACRMVADSQGFADLPHMYVLGLGTFSLEIRGALPEHPFTNLGVARLEVNVVRLSRPPSMEIVGGDNQSAVAESTFSQPFVVQALTFEGQPIAGHKVSFQCCFQVEADGRFPFSSADTMTNSNGIAVAPPFTAGRGLGTGKVTAYMPIPDNHWFVVDEIKYTVTTTDGRTSRELQDMWWSGFQENGWGMSVAQHGDRLFPVIYAYDANGLPTWHVLPAGHWLDGLRYSIFAGDWYSPTGSPYFNYEASRLSVGRPSIQSTLRFSSDTVGQLTVSLVSGTRIKAIRRQDFTSDTPAPLLGLGDMWWGGPSQNGWGIAIMEQAGGLFSVWLTYGADSRPTWLVMPSGAWTSAKTYEGTIYRTQSSTWPDYDARQIQVMAVGSFRYTFHDLNNATFEYTADGHSGAMPIVRQDF